MLCMYARNIPRICLPGHEGCSCLFVSLLLAAEACTLCLCDNACVHTTDTDVIRLTLLVIVKGTVCRLALNVQCTLRLAYCIFAAVAALFTETRTAGLVRHGCLAAVYQNIILGTLLVCIIHTV